VLRYYLNSVHYRNDFNFSEEELQLNKKRLDKLYRLKKRVSPGKASSVNKNFKKALLDAMGDDLNISIALSLIDELISATNDALDANHKDKGLKKETLANIAFIDELLGFGGKEPFSYFQIGVDDVLKEKIESLITERIEAKKAKDFARSDAIRDQLSSRGIMIMDSSNGTLWELDDLFRHQNYVLDKLKEYQNLSIISSIFPSAYINDDKWIYIHHNNKKFSYANEYEPIIHTLNISENIQHLAKTQGKGILILTDRDYFNELKEITLLNEYTSFDIIYIYDIDTQEFNEIQRS